MNDFIKKMLEHGAELDQSTSKIEISMIINDAEILYRKHLAELNLLNVTMDKNSIKATVEESVDGMMSWEESDSLFSNDQSINFATEVFKNKLISYYN